VRDGRGYVVRVLGGFLTKSLVRWQPLQELNSLQRQMNHLFDGFFGRTTTLTPFEETIQMPKRAEARAKQIKVNMPKTLKAA
jgi:hypothetical protein